MWVAPAGAEAGKKMIEIPTQKLKERNMPMGGGLLQRTP